MTRWARRCATLHDQCREALARYVRLAPVIDGVEGTQASVAGIAAADPRRGEVHRQRAGAAAARGILRHKGWRAEKVELPAPKPGTTVIAPAEIEIE